MTPQKITTPASSPADDRVLTITRIFDAPRDLVFDAFTDPKHLMSWWGPNGCTVISCEADLRVGGTWCIAMRSPKVLPQFAQRFPIPAKTGPGLAGPLASGQEGSEDDDSWIVERQRGVYQQIIRPERLVFTYAFEDYAGRPLHQTIVTVTFADERGRTRLTVQQAIFETVSVRDDHVVGWTEALQHLEEYLTQRDRG
jgi:uncharacterized protein YndB with AHSA1/START domain